MACPFPIWSIYITTNPLNPSSIRPDSAREPFWKGRALVCINDESSADWLKNPEWLWWSWAWETKSINTWDKWSATVISEQSTNYQPSISAYVWKRIEHTNDYNPFDIDTTQDSGNALWNPFVVQVWDSAQKKAVPKQPNPYQPN